MTRARPGPGWRARYSPRMAAREEAEAIRSVTVTEVRVLDGPNLYFPRPAVKVSLSVPGYLRADPSVLLDLGARLELRRTRPGTAGSAQRQRFVLRLVERVVRLVARAAGTSRLGVRVRPSGGPDQVVAAFPWRSRGRGEALGHALGEVLPALLEDPVGASSHVQHAAQGVREARPGDPARVVRPTVPVASVTGTNGKTTTTRLLAHLV